MIRTRDLIAFLASTAPGLKVHPEPVPPIPDGPDRLVMVSRTAGLSEINDGLFERPGFRIQVRGLPNNPASAEDDIAALDAAIRTAPLPAEIGEAWVLSMLRRGGLAPTGVDNGERSTWAGLWIVTSSTDL